MKQKQIKNKADKPHGNVCEQMLEMTAAAIGSLPIAANQVDLASTDKSKAGFWAGLINPVLNRSAELLIEAGKHLIAAKKALPPGEWERIISIIPFLFTMHTLNRSKRTRPGQVTEALPVTEPHGP